MERVGHGYMAPNLHHSPFPASELILILYHSSVSSHMTLSVPWSSGGQDKRDMSSSQNSLGPKDSLYQKPYRTGLSVGHVVPPSSSHL